MATRPRVSTPTPPAARPQRNPAADPADVVLGGEDELQNQDGSSTATRGRRSLLRPNSGLNV